ncbi:hypothetical protein CRYUN_Cryun12cG0018100 [Craigia yunnanensis]
MSCRGCLECLLKLLNLLMTLVGLAMVGYGIYLFVEYKKAADTAMLLSPVGSDKKFDTARSAHAHGCVSFV